MNSFEFKQAFSQFAVDRIPKRGSGHISMQSLVFGSRKLGNEHDEEHFPWSNIKPSLHEVQDEYKVPLQVKQEEWQVLQRRSFSSEN